MQIKGNSPQLPFSSQSFSAISRPVLLCCGVIITPIARMEKSQRPAGALQTCYSLLCCSSFTRVMHSKQEITPPVTVDHVRCHIVLHISLVHLLANYKSRRKVNWRNIASISSTTSHSNFLPRPLKNLPHALSFLTALLQPASALYTRYKTPWSLTSLFAH